MEEHLVRALAHVLCAVIADYGRLTAQDDATHGALGKYLDLISDTTLTHRGRLAHCAGYGVPARYGEAEDARCTAVSVRVEVETWNLGAP